MPKKKVKTPKVTSVPKKVEKPVKCGHEEVRVELKKVFTCGEHGEHKLEDCQKLCV